jgi:hypothetical protein
VPVYVAGYRDSSAEPQETSIAESLRLLQRRYLCWPLASREPTPEFMLCEFWLIRFASMTQTTDNPPR